MVTRQQPRFPVSFFGTLGYQNRLHQITKSFDLSRKGCRLESPFEAYTGMKVNLLLSLPEGESPILIEQAVVRWCGVRDMGLEFQSLSSPHRERLDRTLQRFEIAVGHEYPCPPSTSTM